MVLFDKTKPAAAVSKPHEVGKAPVGLKFVAQAVHFVDNSEIQDVGGAHPISQKGAPFTEGIKSREIKSNIWINKKGLMLIFDITFIFIENLLILTFSNSNRLLIKYLLMDEY